MRERIQQLIATLGLNPTQFAQTIGVQRATLQHIINGRNEPSMKFIHAVCNTIANLNVDWLITGRGTPIIQGGEQSARQLYIDMDTDMSKPSEISIFENQPDCNAENGKLVGQTNTATSPSSNTVPANRAVQSKQLSNNKSIVEIMVYYADGKYEKFLPSSQF